MLYLFIFLINSTTYDEVGEKEITLTAGRYKFECYGAQGGQAYDNGKLAAGGGKGAYTKGTLDITGPGTKFYLFIGGQGKSGKTGPNAGGFNGGGSSGSDSKGTGNDAAGGGGGATDIRIHDKSIESRIMVASGGSGGAGQCAGAPGGLLTGVYMDKNNVTAKFASVNQDGGFKDGIGGDGVDADGVPGSGAGGGWRGGYGSNDWSGRKGTNHQAVGTSGTSYISGYTGCPISRYMTFSSPYMGNGTHTGNGKVVLTIVFNCSSHCSACSSKTVCTECLPGYILYNKACWSSCPDGYYKSVSTCAKCNETCQKCENKNTCTSCKSGFVLHEGKCMSKCPDGFYKYSNKCEKCKAPCDRCTSSINCLSCIDDHVLYNRRCITTCQPGTIKNGLTCEPCTDNCATCFSTTSNCTSCSNKFNLFNNTCVLNCPEKTVSLANHCVPCKSPCDSCEEQDNRCTTCIENFYLYENKCYAVCPPGTIKSGGNCVNSNLIKL